MIDVRKKLSFFVERLYQIIDELAFYKFNTFHWHLTDNHSWRIESKAFPVLNDPKHQTPTRNPGVYYSYEGN